MQPEFIAADLEALFRETLGTKWHTELRGGALEPLYLPAEGARPAQIHYTRDYFRSALHEVAHWCIAGTHRRQRVDFGYWYQPDGRDDTAQVDFQRVEQAPQALEWIFCAACAHPFCVSLDNLSGEAAPAAPFERLVRRRAIAWLAPGAMPARAALWASALCRHYRQSELLDEAALEQVFRPL